MKSANQKAKEQDVILFQRTEEVADDFFLGDELEKRVVSPVLVVEKGVLTAFAEEELVVVGKAPGNVLVQKVHYNLNQIPAESILS